METQNKELERLLAETAEYDQKYEAKQKRLHKRLWIATAIILVVACYFGIFNTKFEVREDEEDGYTLEVVASTAWFLQVPKTYQGKEITHVDRTAFYDEEICPNIEFANIRPEGGLFVKNSLFIGLPYSYTFYRDYVELERYNWVAEELTIPKRVWLKPVKAIGQYCFMDTKDYLKKVTIHDKIEKIGLGAFINCENLTEVRGANAVKEVGDSAFERCISLTVVELGTEVEVIGDHAFIRCDALKRIEPQPKLIKIGVWGLGNSELEEFEFNEKASVGCNAFTYTPWLENRPEDFVIFGDGVLYVYKGEADTSIVIPEGIKTLGDASMWDVGLSSVLIPESVTTIEEDTFYYNEEIRIYVPASVTEIGGWSFEGVQNIFVTTENSYAHQYAEEHGISYELVDNLQADWKLEVDRVKVRNGRNDKRKAAYEEAQKQGVLIDIYAIKLGAALEEMQELVGEYDFVWEECSQGVSVSEDILMTQKAVSHTMVEEVYDYPARVTYYFDDANKLRELTVEWDSDCDRETIIENLEEMYGEEYVTSGLRYLDTVIDVDKWSLENGTNICFYPNWYEDGKCMLFVAKNRDMGDTTDIPYREQGLVTDSKRILLNMTEDAIKRSDTRVRWKTYSLSEYQGICKGINYSECMNSTVMTDNYRYDLYYPNYYDDIIAEVEADVLYVLDENGALQEIYVDWGEYGALVNSVIEDELWKHYGEAFTMDKVDYDGKTLEVYRWDLEDGISVLYYRATEEGGDTPKMFIAHTEKITFQ